MGATTHEVAAKDDPTRPFLIRNVTRVISRYDDLTDLEVAEVECILMSLGVEPET